MASEPGVAATGDERDRRLHPASVPLRLVTWARNLLVPGLIVLLLARGAGWEVWLMIFFVPVVIVEIVRYVSLRYRLGGDEIVVRVGLVFRNERHIPFGRIQNIDLVQTPLHRLLRVAEVRLETASGTEPEAVFRVLSLDAVERMRARVFAGRDDDAAADAAAAGVAPSAPPALLQLDTGELVRLGLVSNRGLALVAIAAGVAWELDLYDRIGSLGWAAPALEWLPRGAALALGAAAVAAAPVALLLCSVVWTIIRFHGFRLERRGDDLRLGCGLLTRRAATIPRRRVQFVSVRQSVPQRWIRRRSVRVETAGAVEEPGDDTAALSRKWFAPSVRAGAVSPLLAEIHPDLDLDAVAWQPLAPRARRRVRRKAVLVAMALSVATLVTGRPWGPAIAAVILVPLALAYARAWWRFAGWGTLPGGIAFRSGVWTRRTSATFLDKVQTVSTGQTPFDRRYRMASLRVDTAGAGPAEHRIHIPYLDATDARELLDRLHARSAMSELRW
ncbi:MAG: PH domain-containing protein [Planctomycetota bacterium]|jgi:putative membrane protein